MRWFRGIRLWWPTAALGLFWLVTSIATTYFIVWLDEQHSRVLVREVTSIAAAADMHAVIGRFLASEQALATDPQTSSKKWRESFAALQTSTDRANAAAYTPEERTIVQRIQQSIHHINALFDDLAIADLNRRHALAREIFEELRALNESAHLLNITNQSLLASATSDQQAFTRIIVPTRLVIIIVGPLIGILVGYRVAEQLLNRLAEIRLSLEHASGQTVTVPLSKSEAFFNLDELDREARALAERAQAVFLQFQEAQAEAARNERLAAIGQLAAGIAHEIRNPLTAVKLLVQSAAQKGNREGLNTESLAVVQDEIGRIERTIQDLVDFSRLSPPRRERHDLRETLTRSLNLVRGRASQGGVTIDANIPAEPAPIIADAEQLHQVLVNLLLNGIEAMAHGGTLSVTVERVTASSKYRIVVHDAGEGIAADMLDRVFDPFVTSKKTGAGLGLAISRRIIVEHGGQLVAANDPVGGAVFTIWLPAENQIQEVSHAHAARG